MIKSYLASYWSYSLSRLLYRAPPNTQLVGTDCRSLRGVELHLPQLVGGGGKVSVVGIHSCQW
jgi:hypothetical protein